MRSSVDLPQPDGPTSTVNEPSAMSMSTPCRTGVPPKFFFTCWIVTLAMRLDHPRRGWAKYRHARLPAAMRANR